MLCFKNSNSPDLHISIFNILNTYRIINISIAEKSYIFWYQNQVIVEFLMLKKQKPCQRIANILINFPIKKVISTKITLLVKKKINK